jgi:hypothetical protein
MTRKARSHKLLPGVLGVDIGAGDCEPGGIGVPLGAGVGFGTGTGVAPGAGPYPACRALQRHRVQL